MRLQRVSSAAPPLHGSDAARLAADRHARKVERVAAGLRSRGGGRAVSGCALESMSFQHGGFHDTCLAYEVLTAPGEPLHCTPDNEHALVFQMMHGAFGTLGILSQLTFRLIPAGPYVHVAYETYTT